MKAADVDRRDFLKTVGLGSAAVTITGSTLPVAPVVTGAAEILSVDPRPRFDLSPYLYMQFMEPVLSKNTAAREDERTYEGRSVGR